MDIKVVRTSVLFENGHYTYNLEKVDENEKGTGHFITFTSKYALMIPTQAKFIITDNS